jgi:hypothetical protein
MRSMTRALLLAITAWLLILAGLAVPGPGAAAASSAGASAVRSPAAASHKPQSKPGKPGGRPVVTKVSPKKADTSGGTKITIKGRNLAHVKAVTIGDTVVKKVKGHGGHKIKLTAPAGLPGKQVVRVRTKAGKSAKSKRAKLTYRDRAAINVARYTPKAGTVTGTGVVWVTSAAAGSDPVAGQAQPWLVGVGAGGVVPPVGAAYYLPPGTPALPTGLAGTVADVSDQPGGVKALVVTPTALSNVFSDLDVHYSDAPSAARTAVRDAVSGTGFPDLGGGAFECKNQLGQEVTFSGSLSLSIENIHTNFDVSSGGLFSKPYVNAWVRFEPVLRGTVSATSKMGCSLRPAWVNVHRRVFPIGATGLTVSVAPAASFSVTAAGTLSVEQRTERMVGASYQDGRFSNIDESHDKGLSVRGALSFQAVADVGLSLQFGILDRVGIEAKALAEANGKIEATSDNKVCLDLKMGFKAQIGAFLDLWVIRFTAPAYDHFFVFKKLEGCYGPATPGGSAGAQITTTRLPSAAVGHPYSARLATTDNRPGRWALVGGALPAGLILDPDNGEVSGTPSGTVGDYVAAVSFTDGAGASTTATIRTYLYPDLVGGGAFQATLTWGSFADLDLHTVDPFGEEIYYAHDSSDSGGVLDRDANAACDEQISNPIENIYWPSGGAPSGTYEVSVVTFNDCSVSNLNWHLVVRVGGQVVLDRTGSGDSDVFEVNVGSSRQAPTVRDLGRGPGAATYPVK